MAVAFPCEQRQASSESLKTCALLSKLTATESCPYEWNEPGNKQLSLMVDLKHEWTALVVV